MRSSAMFSPILLQLLLLKTMESRSTRNSDTLDYQYNDYNDNMGLNVVEDMDVKLKNTALNRRPSKVLSLPTLSKLNLPPGLSVAKDVKNTVQLSDDSTKEAPDYMMDLYKRFSNNHISHPSSNIVRSFMNINTEDVIKKSRGKKALSGKQTRVHRMIFNITSISLEESIDLAELRLYTLVERDRFFYVGVDRKVSVYEVKENNDYQLIDSKHIYGRDSGWETFDVTSAVERWIQQLTSLQILEIRIESVFHSLSLGDLDILTQPKNKKEPLLVVFSSDENNKRLHMNERHELVTHEMDAYDVQKPLTIDHNETSVIPNQLTNGHSRIKRRGGRRYGVCRRRPMYVSFKEINWDSWIIAPHGYQAYECTGRCYFPLSDHLSPTKHAIIQSLLHTTAPRRISRACCVPTKLDPISILYIDEQGVITYKYRYDGMIVSECGCR